MPEFISRDADGVHLHPHSGQLQALQSQARVIAVISGAQGGKTSLGPIFMWQEMQRRGPGDYMCVTPTFPLLDASALPKMRDWFEATLQLGRYVGSPTKRFEVSEDGERRLWGHKQTTRTMIRFGHASDSNSLEAVSLKGLWCDEAGQPEFKRASWNNLYTRRLAVHQGRALLTTTPYTVDGWLRELCDRAATDSTIEVIRFDSTANPAFPSEMWEEARRTLPGWQFDLMFRAIWTRPAGQIYDCFNDRIGGHLVQRFEIPAQWKRFIGLDFGGVNTCATFWAEERYPTDAPNTWGEATGRFVCYRCYLAGNRTAAEHVRAILAGEPRVPACVGGAASEGQWRNEFAAAGLPIQRPQISEVEVGVNRVYAAIRTNTLLVMSDLAPLIQEFRTYSRKVDQNGNVTEEIADKASYHHLDSARYIWSLLRGEEPRVQRVTGAARRAYGYV